MVYVKGRKSPTWVYELVCKAGKCTELQKDIGQYSSIAMGCFMGRDFEKCKFYLEKIQAKQKIESITDFIRNSYREIYPLTIG